MTQPTPPGDRSSLASMPENVVFLDSSVQPPAKPAEAATIDPYAVDGGMTIKTGGMPVQAWQASAGELAKHLVGKQLGTYFIEEALGAGGMSAVFRAIDPQLDRHVALKILPPVLAVNQEHVQRFEREAKVAAQLDSEHVARVHQYGQDQGLHYIAYEYVEGTNLRDLLTQQGGRLSIPDAINFLKQAAQGLADTAARGIIHRDIKPSNLVVTAQGKLKLVDLGLARNSLSEDSAALTQDGATLGTFDYLSPEQAIDPRLADVRSDIYSLGCTFYHALTGEPPVPEGTAARKLHSHQMELPCDPRELNAAITPPLYDILCKMLAKKPADRYQTAEELVQAVQALSQPFFQPAFNREPRQTAATTSSLPWYVSLVCMMILAAGAMVWDSMQTSGDRNSPSTSTIASGYLELRQETGATKASTDTEVKESAISPITMEVDTIDELQKALMKPTGGTIYLRRSLYEISDNNNVLLLKGGHWTLRPVEGGTSTIRLQEGATAPLFDISAGSLRLQHLKLEISSSSTGILAHDDVQVALQHCELIRLAESNTALSRPVASSHAPFIRMTGTSTMNSPAALEIHGSIWHPSQGIGIVLENASYVHMDDCWVAPQHQFLAMSSMGATAQKRLAILRHCSIVQPHDACFKISGTSPVRLELEHCLFSKYNSTSMIGDESAWLVQDNGSQVDLQSNNSVLYRISNYCSIQRDSASREVVARDWQQLRSTLARFHDEGSSTTSRSPWLESRPWQRYLETRKLSALMPKAEYSHVGPEELLGQSLRSVSAIAKEPGESSTKSGRTLIVDGRGEEPGTYSTINSALGSVADEEETTIVLQLHGIVPLKPTEVGNSRIVIKAAEGYRPELTFHRDTIAGPDGEAHLFRVHDGELMLENVKLRLEALRDQARTLTLMVVTGTGKCRLKDTLVSLKGTNEFTASVCTVGDPQAALSPGKSTLPRAGVARFDCSDTIIRGTGQVLQVQTCRPFLAQFQQCGIALDGILFFIDGIRSDMVLPGEPAQLQLDRCTCYSTRGFMQLRSTASMPQLLTVRCQLTQSILAVSENIPIVKLDIQNGDNDLKRKLLWQGRRNCYVATGAMLASQQPDQNAMAILYDTALWSELWGGDDEQAQFMKSLPLAGLLRQTSLSEWESAEFLLKMDGSSPMGMRDVGVSVEAMPKTTSQSP